MSKNNNKPVQTEESINTTPEVKSVPAEETAKVEQPKMTESAKVAEAPKPVETKKEEVKKPAPIPSPEVKSENVKKEVKSSHADIKVGDTVTIVPTASTTVTGVAIPAYAYKNTYKVAKILTDRVVIKEATTGILTYGMRISDITK